MRTPSMASNQRSMDKDWATCPPAGPLPSDVQPAEHTGGGLGAGSQPQETPRKLGSSDFPVHNGRSPKQPPQPSVPLPSGAASAAGAGKLSGAGPGGRLGPHGLLLSFSLWMTPPEAPGVCLWESATGRSAPLPSSCVQKRAWGQAAGPCKCCKLKPQAPATALFLFNELSEAAAVPCAFLC